MSYSLESNYNIPIKIFDYQSSVKKYEFEWSKVSKYLLANNLQELKKLAINGHLKTSKFRSICWSLFFGLLDNEDYKKWSAQRIEQRKRYTLLKNKFFLNPHKVEENQNDDPLSQSHNSIWNQHFCDQELCAVIKQDVVRTFPGIEFFRKNQIQEIMTSILFCYARENPIMCYRQGMHEILAPVIFVIHSDHQAFLHFKELNGEFDPVLCELLNPKHLEEDSFLLFAHIMTKIESFYRITDLVPTATGYFPSSPNISKSPDNYDDVTKTHRHEVEVVDQLNIIRDKILVKEDIALHDYLLEMDIPLALFGIRWLRLLFGREFPLQDLLILWDAIFAEEENFLLTSYIVVAMLVTIRDKLLSGDYTTCLTYLMKYPNTVDITHIIKLALHMKSPNIYDNPSPNIIQDRAATLPRNSKTRQSFSQTKTLKVETERKRSSSIVGVHEVKLSEENQLLQARVNGIQTMTAKAAVRLAAQNHSIGEPDLGIVDGYLENDPEVSILTLQHAQSIMAISRLKLLQYLATIRQNIPEKCNDNVCQALDGIEEICSLLKSTYSIPILNPNSIPAPVEPAFEANEAVQIEKNKNIIKSFKLNLNQSNNTQNSNQPTSKQQRIINSNEKLDKQNVTLLNNAVQSSSASSSKPIKIPNDESRYELPDNSRIADRLFGGVRDIPMRVFKSATNRNLNENIQDEIKTMPTPDPTKERDSLVLLEKENVNN